MTTDYQMAIAGCISAAMAADEGDRAWTRTIKVVNQDGTSRNPIMREFRIFIRAQSAQLRQFLETDKF